MRFKRIRATRAILLLISINLLAIGVNGQNAASPKTDAALGSNNPNHKLEKEQELEVPFWTLEPGWDTQLEVRNNLAHGDLDITPILRKADGSELQATALKISSDAIKRVDLQSVAADWSGRADAYGSLVLRYKSVSSGVYAAVLVQRKGHPISFHFDAYPVSSQFSRGSRESVWWLPHATSDGFLIISNFSSGRVQAEQIFTQGKNQYGTAIALAPHQTQRISIREVVERAGFQPTQGGVKVDFVGGAGYVYVAEILFDESAEFSAIMKVFERDPNARPGVYTLRAPLVGLATPDPMLAYPAGTILHPNILVRNAADITLGAEMIVNWRSSKSVGRFPLRLAPLAPEETRVLDLTLLQKDRLPVDANWAKVEITYTGRPGDIVAIANSYDATTRYGIQSPFTDSLSFMWKGGMWHVDAQHNTLITTGNAGTKDASVAVTLFYGDKGIYELPEKTLAPGEQTWLEVGNLIRNQIPDKKGRLLPPGTMEGSYEIKDINDKQIGYLYEGKVITDKTFGHATYGCASCCNYGGVGYSGFYLLPNPLVGIVGGYGDYQGQATNQCTGQTDIVDAYSYISSNPPVATVDNAGHTSFVAPGTSNVTAYAKLQSVQNCCCRPQTYEGQAPTNVCPTSASAAWTDPLNLSLLFPTLLSGIGNVARVTVGPATSNLDGQTVTESVSQSSNTCPSVVPNACVGGSTFIVGLGYQPNVCTAWNGSTCTTRTNVGPLLVATHNQFFDQNTAVSPQSFLSSGQCTQTCSQQYYCGTQKFSDRTFTYNFQKSTMNGTTVTLVTLQ